MDEKRKQDLYADPKIRRKRIREQKPEHIRYDGERLNGDSPESRYPDNGKRAERKESRKRSTVLCFVAAVFAVIIFGEMAVYNSPAKLPSAGTETLQASPDPKHPEEGQPGTDSRYGKAGASETEISEEMKEELVRSGEDSVREQIFGTDESGDGIAPYLTIDGLTVKERRDSGFVESDFLRKAGLFLKDRGITTKRIIVENRIDSSVPGGMAFQARLERQDGYLFQFILVPSMPGSYIFTLQEMEKEVEPETAAEKRSRDTERQDQESSGQVQPEGRSTSMGASKSDYDATKLSIRSVPEELMNYLDNPYVFQYQLYDYLYKRGRKTVGQAEVTEYSIDSVKRTASIKLKLSDGSGLTAIYSHDSGTYTFS